MKFRADDTRGDFSVSLELTEEEKGSLEEVITNLSVGLAGVVTELLHTYCSTRKEAQRLASLVLREQQSALALYTDKFFAGEDDEAEEQRLYESMEEIYEEAWFKTSGYESEEALKAAFAGQPPLRLDCRMEENGFATVFVTNREKTEVLGQVDTALAAADPESFETSCGMYQMVATVLGDKLYGEVENPIRKLYFGALRDKIKAMVR